MTDALTSDIPIEEVSPPTVTVVKNFGVNELSDVCLVVGHTEFNVHKMILANRSKYFQVLFFGNFKEKDENRIEIVDADPLAFERMLDVIYDLKFKDTSFFSCGEKTGNTSKVFWEGVGNLLTVLDRFDVPHGRTEFFKAFNESWCKPVDGNDRCSFCVNRFVFCYARELKVTGDIKHNSESIAKWAKKHFDGVPETIASDVIKKLLLRMLK